MSDCKCYIDHIRATPPWTCTCPCHNQRIEEPLSERTYTESELAAERAALLREVTKRIIDALKLTRQENMNLPTFGPGLQQALTLIKTIPTDQSALARIEAAAYERGKRDATYYLRTVTVPANFVPILRGILTRTHALQDRGREADNDQ